jgi:molybdate transport system substrate-binding protein
VPTLRNTVIRGFALSAVLLLVVAKTTPARAEYVIAPDVVVFCEPTLRPAIADVARLWRGQTGVPVRILSAPTALLLEEVSHHIRADLLIGEGEDAAALAVRRKLVKPDTRVALWRNRLVVAERATQSQSLPAHRTLAALIGAGPVALVDASAATAGVDSRKALETLGMWDAAQRQSVGVVGTADAVFLLAHGKVQLAIVYATDLAANRELSAAATPPDDAYEPITYWLAETNNFLSPNAGKFAMFLRQPPAQQLLRADGLEILP